MPPFQHLLHHGMCGGKPRQHVLADGIARLRLFAVFETEFVEQHFSELFWRSDVERRPRSGINGGRKGGELFLVLDFERREPFGVHAYTALFHCGEHDGQRLFHFVKQFVQPLLGQRLFRLLRIAEHLRRTDVVSLGAEHCLDGLYGSAPARQVRRGHNVEKRLRRKAVFFQKGFVIITNERAAFGKTFHGGDGVVE